MTTATSYGILNPRAGEAKFTLDRRPPSSDLEAFVERYWIVRWSLRERTPFAQETLPHPNVNGHRDHSSLSSSRGLRTHRGGGAAPCGSSLAQELGYFDQAHFIRDFKSQVGQTPAEYAAACGTAT